MTFLRFLVIVFGLWYLARIVGRWIFGTFPGGMNRPERRDGTKRPGDGPVAADRYRELTDQRIEDAEFEEIDPEERE